MVIIIISIVAGLSLIAAIIFLIKLHAGKEILLDCFSAGNVIVFGKKGKGKDTIFNFVINNRKKQCYANIPYNKDLCIERSIKEFSVEPNTFENIIENNITQIKKTNKEDTDYYISDAGSWLPSQYEGKLNKKYPSFPIYYALSRHLTNSNIHCNSQYLGRVWSKIREQADSYIMANGTINILGLFLITKFRYYELYTSAMSGMLPFKASSISTSEIKAAAKDHEAKHGVIKDYIIIQPIKDLKYDTRYFHYRFYGKRAPNSKRI